MSQVNYERHIRKHMSCDEITALRWAEQEHAHVLFTADGVTVTTIESTATRKTLVSAVMAVAMGEGTMLKKRELSCPSPSYQATSSSPEPKPSDTESTAKA